MRLRRDESLAGLRYSEQPTACVERTANLPLCAVQVTPRASLHDVRTASVRSERYAPSASPYGSALARARLEGPARKFIIMPFFKMETTRHTDAALAPSPSRDGVEAFRTSRVRATVRNGRRRLLTSMLWRLVGRRCLVIAAAVGRGGQIWRAALASRRYRANGVPRCCPAQVIRPSVRVLRVVGRGRRLADSGRSPVMAMTRCGRDEFGPTRSGSPASRADPKSRRVQ